MGGMFADDLCLRYPLISVSLHTFRTRENISAIVAKKLQSRKQCIFSIPTRMSPHAMERGPTTAAIHVPPAKLRPVRIKFAKIPKFSTFVATAARHARCLLIGTYAIHK